MNSPATLVSIFLLTFCAMEFTAWFLHKYVMHGFLWVLHIDHHDPNHKKWWQKNDAFAVVFFFPSFFSLLYGSLNQAPAWMAFGYGIMAYGAAYFYVHEVVIHRRLKWFKSNNVYFDALVSAHKKHHSVHTQTGATEFGMLITTPEALRRAWHRRKQRAQTSRH